MNYLLLIFSFLTITSCQSSEPSKVVSPPSTKKEKPAPDTPQKIKYETHIDFEKFKVDTSTTTKRAPVNFASNPSARRFRSAIKWAIDKFGMNFGGHYNLASWGCGTSCQNGVITDFTNGNVYDVPPATGDYEFRKGSKLLVVNPPDSAGYYYGNCSYCVPELWSWNEKKKKFQKVN